MMAIVDALTGTVYPPPLSIDKSDPLALPHFGFVGYAKVDYKLDSRLFVMESCTWPDVVRDTIPCSTSSFSMEPFGFKLVKRIDWDRSPRSPQPIVTFSLRRSKLPAPSLFPAPGFGVPDVRARVVEARPETPSGRLSVLDRVGQKSSFSPN